MTGSRFLACFAALALSTSACGTFKSTDSKGDDGPRGGEIGGELPDIETTLPPTTRVTRPTTTRKPAVTTNPDACKPGDNTSEVRYDPGLVLEYTVGTTCAARGADVSLKLKVTNTGSKEIRYNPNQVEFFSIKPPRGEQKSSWRDRDCTPPPTGDRRKLAKTIVPGMSLEFATKYPGPDGVANRENCRRLDTGAYDAFAVFVLCEGEAFEDGYCDIGKGDQLFAQPLRINFLP